jgi:hypothetical protein
LSKPTRAVFFETPSNPMQDLVDIQAVSDLAHGAGATVIVDNVFATPVLQSPLRLGADVVVYSTTKHIDGQGPSRRDCPGHRASAGSAFPRAACGSSESRSSSPGPRALRHGRSGGARSPRSSAPRGRRSSRGPNACARSAPPSMPSPRWRRCPRASDKDRTPSCRGGCRRRPTCGS